MSMMDMLPDSAYNSEPHIVAYQEALNKQVQKVEAARDDFLQQARPGTATWGMSRYEREWGILVNEDNPLDKRLAIWRSRRRGYGVTTVEAIKRIAESFYNGQVDVVQHRGEFWVEIFFRSPSGNPINIADIRDAVSAVIPAHVECVYMAQRTWGDVYTENATWADVLGVMTWQDILDKYPTWGDVVAVFQNWGKVYGERTWGEISSYIWEEI